MYGIHHLLPKQPVHSAEVMYRVGTAISSNLLVASMISHRDSFYERYKVMTQTIHGIFLYLILRSPSLCPASN